MSTTMRKLNLRDFSSTDQDNKQTFVEWGRGNDINIPDEEIFDICRALNALNAQPFAQRTTFANTPGFSDIFKQQTLQTGSSAGGTLKSFDAGGQKLFYFERDNGEKIQTIFKGNGQKKISGTEFGFTFGNKYGENPILYEGEQYIREQATTMSDFLATPNSSTRYRDAQQRRRPKEKVDENLENLRDILKKEPINYGYFTLLEGLGLQSVPGSLAAYYLVGPNAVTAAMSAFKNFAFDHFVAPRYARVMPIRQHQYPIKFLGKVTERERRSVARSVINAKVARTNSMLKEFCHRQNRGLRMCMGEYQY